MQIALVNVRKSHVQRICIMLMSQMFTDI